MALHILDRIENAIKTLELRNALSVVPTTISSHQKGWKNWMPPVW